jgi:hypothetical protein
MKYISKIIIENFQSHSLSVFTLKQGLNVIVGPSDSGKSAVIRALKWVLYNEPAGDFFIREGEKECSVTVEFNDGTTLKRYRSRSKNGYVLINPDDEEMRFEGIGSGVPKEIVDATGITKIILDQDSSSAINLGEQLEGPFLLTEKPSTRANAIGRLVGVNLLDDALRDVLRDIRSISLRNEEALIKLDEEIKDFEYLDELRNRSMISSAFIKEAENLLEVKTRLEFYFKSLNDISIEKNHQLDSLIKLSDIDNAKQDIEVAANLVFKYEVLKSKSNNFKQLLEERSSWIKASSLLDHIEDIQKIESETSSLTSRLTALSKFYTEYKNVLTEKEGLIDRLKYLKSADETEQDVGIVVGDLSRYSRLIDLSNKYNEAMKGIAKGKDYLGKLENFLNNEDRINLCNTLSERQLIIKSIKSRYEDNKQNINITLNELKINDERHRMLLERYGDLLIEIGKCPYCLSDISEDTVEHLIKNHLGGQ